MGSTVPKFDLSLCRELSVERPVVEVREDDVTAAFRRLAEATKELQDKSDFNALARLLGLDDALALRREVRAQLERQRDDAVAKILRLRVLGGLLSGFVFEPEADAVRLEVASLVRDAEELGQQVPSHKVGTVVEPLARKRVVSSALVRSLAEALEVQPDEGEVMAAFERHAQLFRDPAAVLEHLEQSQAAAKPVVDELVENMVVREVLKLAQVIERPISLQELADELERVALAFGQP